MAVKAIAVSIGKNIIKTGIKIVPKPKPEKKVRKEAAKAAIGIIKIIMIVIF